MRLLKTMNNLTQVRIKLHVEMRTYTLPLGGAERYVNPYV
jgi:hypothetical protein